jgi:hypothetical protein
MVMTEDKLIDEFLEAAGKDIARQIDEEILDTIMIDVLKSEGWTATTMNPAYEPPLTRISNGEWYSETAEWIHLNATGDYKLLMGRWLFEKKEDAVMFTLKWS